MTEIVQTIPAELTRPELYTGIAPDGVASLQAAFAPHFHAFHGLQSEAEAIGQDQPKAARALRLKLKAIRVDAEKTRKALKEDSLRRGKAIDGVNALLEYQLVPIEQAMEEIEKAEERREAARKAALRDARMEELRPYADPTHYALGEMPEEAWQQLLAGAKAAKAERERLAAEAEARRIEQERLAEEARIKAEAERQAELARLRAEREKAEAERAAAAKAQAEAEAKAAEERKAAEAKLAAELAAAAEREAKARAEAEAKLAAERAAADAERKRLAAEAAKAKAEADRLAALEAQRKAEAERKAAEEAKAAREAAAAPERQKVAAFAAMLRGLQAPDLQTEAGKELAARIQRNLGRLADFCDDEAAKL